MNSTSQYKPCQQCKAECEGLLIRDAKTDTAKAYRYHCFSCNISWDEVIVPPGHDGHKTGSFKGSFICWTCNTKKRKDAKHDKEKLAKELDTAKQRALSKSSITLDMSSGGTILLEISTNLLALSNQDFELIRSIRELISQYMAKK